MVLAVFYVALLDSFSWRTEAECIVYLRGVSRSSVVQNYFNYTTGAVFRVLYMGAIGFRSLLCFRLFGSWLVVTTVEIARLRFELCLVISISTTYNRLFSGPSLNLKQVRLL